MLLVGAGAPPPRVRLQRVALWRGATATERPARCRGGGESADRFTPPSSSSCRLWVGRKVTRHQRVRARARRRRRQQGQSTGL